MSYKYRIKYKHWAGDNLEIINRWYKEGTPLNKISGFDCGVYTDGIDKVELKSSSVRAYCYVESDNTVEPMYTNNRGIKNENFLLTSLKKLAEEYFIFLIRIDIATVLFVHGNSFGLDYDGNDWICHTNICDIGDVISMNEKRYCVRKDLIADTRNTQNTCPIPTPELQELLENNYVLVRCNDGSQGWIVYGGIDREKYDTPEEEVHICIHFGDDSFIHTFSSNIKEIIQVQPKKINFN